MTKRKITIEVDEELLERYNKYYPTLAEGIDIGLTAWINIRRDTIYAMRGYFTENETKFIIEYIKDCPYHSSDHLSELILSDKCDGIDFVEDLATANKTDLSALEEKLSKISSAEQLAIADWAKRYWTSGTNINDYISQLTQQSEFLKRLDKMNNFIIEKKALGLNQDEINELLQKTNFF